MKNKKAFTLIELLAVIIILGIILLIAVPTSRKYLNKGTKTYYQNLEKTVLLAGREYLNDYKVLLPRVINNVTVVELDELVSNKYIKDVVDHNEKECKAVVTVKKVADSKYEYYSCLKCDEYESESENCGFSEDNNVTAGSGNYVIKVDKDYYEIAQGTEFTLPIGQVYYEDEQVATTNPSPKVIDTNALGETTVVYSYKQVKKSIKVKVVDKIKPSAPTVVMRKDTINGDLYTSGWYSGNIYQLIESTDYTKPNLIGSGIDYYMINYGTGFVKLTGSSEAIGSVVASSGINYLITSETGEYTFEVKSVDKAGNESDIASYSFKIDKEDPKVKVSTSGKVATMTLTDNIELVGYGINQSKTTPPSNYTKVSGKNVEVKYTATKAGTYYAWVIDSSGRTSYATFEMPQSAFCAYNVGQTWNFSYTGGVQSFKTPCSGTYKLEVWGAQGGNIGREAWQGDDSSLIGGLGGYSYGNKTLTQNQQIYITVGSQPANLLPETEDNFECSDYDDEDEECDEWYIPGGYNGGGPSYDWYNNGGGHANTGTRVIAGAGGGATHISTTNRGELKNYSSYRSEVLIVAGGGGGTDRNSRWAFAGGGKDTCYGGDGGGNTGGKIKLDSYTSCHGYDDDTGECDDEDTEYGDYNGTILNNAFIGSNSTQTAGYQFGQGANSSGGGWYGGYYFEDLNVKCGSGGSGYIGGVTNGSMQNGVRSGHGYARITLVSIGD